LGIAIFLEIFWLREEGSFADHIIRSVQDSIKGLESEVGHSHMVGVGIEETNRDFPAP
jgi:hypothetical protein